MSPVEKRKEEAEKERKAIEKRKDELRRLSAALSRQPIDLLDHTRKKEKGASTGTEPRKEWYLPFHEQPGNPRGSDPVSDLRVTIDLAQDGTTAQLFSGFQGSGKSTELYRLARDLKDAGFPVLFIRGNEVLNMTKPLETSDLLLSVAAAVGIELEETLGDNPSRRKLSEKVSDFFKSIRISEVELGLGIDVEAAKAVKASVKLAKIKMELKENPTFKTQVQSVLRGTFHQFLEGFRLFMKESRELLGVKDGGKSPVLIVDDLEKVRGMGPDADVVQKSMEQIFWDFHYALKIKGWHSIWAAPPYLQLVNPAIAGNFDECVVLPMIRLWENKESRARDADGIEAMKRCLRLRGDTISGNLDSLFMSDRSLDDLIEVSSGHLRDLVGLMQTVVREAFKQKDPRQPLNELTVRRVLNDYVSDGQKGLFATDLPWLSRLCEERQIAGVLTDPSVVTRAAKLIDTTVIMTYRNGEEWFDVSLPVRKLLTKK